MTQDQAGLTTGPYRHGGALSSSDAFSWRMEGDPGLRSTVVSLLVLDRAPEWPDLVARVEQLTRVVPVLLERVRADALHVGPPRFVPVPDVDLTQHLRRVSAAAPGDLPTLLEMARVEGEEAFDPARPLWRMTLVERVHVPSSAPDDPPGRAALIIKMHHSLADGLGALQIAVHLFDAVRHPPSVDEEPAAGAAGDRAADAPAPPFSITVQAPELLHDALGDAEAVARGAAALPGAAARAAWSGARHPRRALRTATSIARFVAPISTTMSSSMTRRTMGRRYGVLDVDLHALRDAARAADCTVNDAFLAAVTGGLDRYQGRHSYRSPELRVTMPLSLRRPGDEEGGNRLTLVRMPVPVRDPDPVRRMQEINRRVRARRQEPANGYAAPIAAVLNLLPRQYLGSMLKHVDFLASNVVGFPAPVYLAGAQVLRQYPFGPTIGAALNITLMSYCGRCWVGITTDTGAVPDDQALVELLREGFEEVCGTGAVAPG